MRTFLEVVGIWFALNLAIPALILWLRGKNARAPTILGSTTAPAPGPDRARGGKAAWPGPTFSPAM